MTVDTTSTTLPKSLMSNQTFDVLKWIAQVVLPALGALYFALAGIWGFPYGEQVIGSITAIDLCLGVLLGVSTNTYYKSGAAYDGTMTVPESDPVATQNSVLLQVVTKPDSQ